MNAVRDAIQRMPKAPAEGWTSLLSVFVLTLMVAWSIDQASGRAPNLLV